MRSGARAIALAGTLAACTGEIEGTGEPVDVTAPAALASPVSTTGDQLVFYQGDYNNLWQGNPYNIGYGLAQYDVIVLSHLFTRTREGFNVADSKFAGIETVLASIRYYNPAAKIFGYVSPTWDGPWPKYENPDVSIPAAWTCPPAGCQQAWQSVLDLKALGVDGVFFDYMHPAHTPAAVRDTMLYYAHVNGLFAMSNNLGLAAGTQFILDSPFFVDGDYVLHEAFVIAKGAWTNATNAEAIVTLDLVQQKRFAGRYVRFAALATTLPGGYLAECTLAPGGDYGAAAYKLFQKYQGPGFTYNGRFEPGDVFAYQNSALSEDPGGSLANYRCDRASPAFQALLAKYTW